MINEQNIVAFISTLYQKKYGEPAPADLLNKWSRLSNREIEINLHELFNHWGYSKDQAQTEINNFLATQNSAHKQVVESKSHDKKKLKFPFGYILFVLLLAGIGYVLYEYNGYKNLGTVYCLTDNVTLRMADGTKVGRMDLFPRKKNDIASFGKLIAASDQPILKKFPDLKSEILVRELFLKNDFISYLLGNKNERVFASNAYLTESKQEYQLFKSVFKDLQKNKRENAKLKFVYRKVIVGCLRISNKLNAHITLPCDGIYDKKYEGLLRVNLKQGKYQVIAKLNDGKYYHFIGNARDNEFAKIRTVETKILDIISYDILSKDVLFRNIGGTIYLYSCDGEDKHYKSSIMNAENPQIRNFFWYYPF